MYGLYQPNINEEASYDQHRLVIWMERTAGYSKIPGCSEHHTGRALDIGTLGCEPLSEKFAESTAFDWLTRNAAKFGYVLVRVSQEYWRRRCYDKVAKGAPLAAEERGTRMHSAIADKQKELAELCRRYDVARLELFGSAARGADFDPQTGDADFLVEFNPDSSLAPFDQFFDLAEALRNTLGRRVDLVESGAVRNPYLRAAIDRSRVLVYAS